MTRRLEVRAGKKVYEIRPRVAWDKGDAVRLIREQLGHRDALAIVVGRRHDRRGHAFTAFDDAITICVDPVGHHGRSSHVGALRRNFANILGL